jgi:hypothetical protein
MGNIKESKPDEAAPKATDALSVVANAAGGTTPAADPKPAGDGIIAIPTPVAKCGWPTRGGDGPPCTIDRPCQWHDRRREAAERDAKFKANQCGKPKTNGGLCAVQLPCKWHAEPPLRCESVTLTDPYQRCQLQKEDGVAFCSQHVTYPDLGRHLMDYVRQHRYGRPNLETFLSTAYPGVQAPPPFGESEFPGHWTRYVKLATDGAVTAAPAEEALEPAEATPKPAPAEVPAPADMPAEMPAEAPAQVEEALYLEAPPPPPTRKVTLKV